MASELHTVSISITRSEFPPPASRFLSSQKHSPSIQTSESSRRGLLLIESTVGFIRRNASLKITAVFRVESHENNGTMTTVKNTHSIGFALIEPPTDGSTLETNGRPGIGRSSKRTPWSTASDPETQPKEHITHTAERNEYHPIAYAPPLPSLCMHCI